jgi:hypothetical protein
VRWPRTLEPNRNSVALQSLIFLAAMRQAAAHRRAPRASAFRRILTALLVGTYVIVGFGGEISCAEETLATANSLDASAVTDKSDEGSKKTPTVVEHCYTCAPVVMPALFPVAEPSAEPVKLSFEAPTFLLEDHPWVDTPPPKHLA